MITTKPTRLLLPALRGIMGDRVYYSCLTSLNEIGPTVQLRQGQTFARYIVSTDSCEGWKVNGSRRLLPI